MTRLRQQRATALAAAALVAVLVVGCGHDASEPAPAEATGRLAGPTGQVELQLPEGYPTQFPVPPSAVAESAKVEEHALLGQGMRTELGTIVRATVVYRYGRGARSETFEVLDYYRAVLPGEGWTITVDEPPAAGQQPHRSRPGHRLRVDGHGWHNLTVTVELGRGATDVRVSVVEFASGRRPSQHPPAITLPGWYRELPVPPPGLRRVKVRVTAALDEASTYYLEYEKDPNREDPGADLSAPVLAQYYLRELPMAGWAVGRVRQRVERPGRYGGVIEHQHEIVDLAGYGVSGEVHIRTSVSVTGQPLRSRVFVTIPAAGLSPEETTG